MRVRGWYARVEAVYARVRRGYAWVRGGYARVYRFMRGREGGLRGCEFARKLRDMRWALLVTGTYRPENEL
ncbi:putative AlkP superfamily phosphohydrolase/phosphomutase [Sporosarcina luteola]|nr:putative AlkP superfamily phosphohydrolase/phosphomutase [Sporosarcina luteola]